MWKAEEKEYLEHFPWIVNCEMRSVNKGFPGGSDGKESACNMGDPSLIPGSGTSPGKGNGNPVQYSCLENPMDGGAWRATVHGVTQSWTQPSDFTFTFLHFHSMNKTRVCINCICFSIYINIHCFFNRNLYKDWFS